MTTALDQLRALWASGDRLKALALASRWPRLGDPATKTAIQRGHAAAQNPDMYKQMKQNPEALVADGLAALATLHNLPQGA